MSSVKFIDVAHLLIGCECFDSWNNCKVTLTAGALYGYTTELPKGEVLPIKPLLRPLLDMTEEEAIEMAKLTECDYAFNDVKTEKTKYGDWIVTWQGSNESRERVNVTGDVFYCYEQFLYLLKKGFDIFELIYHGEALDATNAKEVENG